MVGRLLHVRTGRHPHEILVVIATTLLGVAGTIAPHKISNAVQAEFPGSWATVFWAVLAITGSITLYGIFNRKIEGLLIERGGLTLQAAAYGAYVYAVSQYAGWGGLVSMALPSAFAIGNLMRCWQIKTDLALLTNYLKDHPGEQVR